MILALDTDVLVHWAMAGAAKHEACRRLVRSEIDGGGQLGLASQVLFELVHVCTDSRRFEDPMSMDAALRMACAWWDSNEVVHLHQKRTVLHRAFELMQRHTLGRKRILDTVLAATLEANDIDRLATLNARDYRVLGLFELVVPE